MKLRKYYLTPGDILLIIVLGISVLGSLLIFRNLGSHGKFAAVYVGKELVYRLSLSEDKEVTVCGSQGESHIKVEDNRIFISQAPCPHKTCMKMGKINRTGETIICIPNRIILKIEGNTDRELDGITM
jgi:hypothetical protein